jgi:carboxyl-terminal processing protease
VNVKLNIRLPMRSKYANVSALNMMIASLLKRLSALALSSLLGLSIWAAENSVPQDSPPATSEQIAPLASVKPIVPGPADGRIAFITARMLEQLHYLKQPFDGSISSKFLDRYLETLDPQHMHFLQSDLADFETYRTNLNHLTITRRGVADTTPAFDIFNRYMTRLRERVVYADELLKTEKFTFDTDERIAVNRQEMPYPKNMDEAKQLWRDRLRYEYLQERLGKLTAKKKPEAKVDAAKDSPDTAPEAKVAAKPKTEAEEIGTVLTNRYHRNLRAFTDFTNDDVLQIYLTALSHVYDPHSDYLGQAQLDSFSIGMNLSLFGIGAELRSVDGYCTINRLLPGGPATKSKKIKEKDRIIAVAQSNQPPVDVVDMNLTKAVQLIRGPKGSEVRLTIIPAGEDASGKKTISLIRDEIPLEDQAAKSKLIELPGPQNLRLGVIDLPSFYASFDPAHTRSKSEPKSTTADVAKLITKLKQENISGLILDLRRNGGGSLEEAIRLTGLFIKDGPVVQVKDSEGSIQEDDDDDTSILYDGPLIVLTSRFSASASEIVAGALQDYGRALVIGDISTHGKGTVQSVNPLKPYMQLYTKGVTNEPGALKITIKKFYRASGASTQLKGVTPDIVLPSIFNDSKDFGESSLENPLPWDTIKSSKYEHLNRVDPYLADLHKQSDERVAADNEFSYIREDIEIFKKQQADKTVSLNEKQLLKERQEAEARKKSREKERLARKDPQEKVYEISLKLADKPGLPPPVEKTNTLAKASSRDAVPSTDNLAHAAAPSRVDPENPEEEEEKPVAVDPVMSEAEKVLVDYLGLLRRSDVAWAVIKP